MLNEITAIVKVYIQQQFHVEQEAKFISGLMLLV